MYTATIKTKNITNGVLSVEIEFTDGVTTVTETVRPIDYENLKAWVANRLVAYNAAKDIDATYPVGTTIVTTTTPTQAELDRDAWLASYRKLEKIKRTLVDIGVLTGNEAWYTNLRNTVKNNLLQEYLDFI